MKANNELPIDIAGLITSPFWQIRYISARNDPALFVKYFLPKAWNITKDYPKQQQFLRQAINANEGILRAGSRSGKTYTMSMLILFFLFYRIRPKESYFYGDYKKTYQILNAALTLNQAKLVMNNIIDMCNDSPFFQSIKFLQEIKNGQSPELITCLNSKLDVRPTVHGGRHILGEYYDIVNIDEAASEPDLNHLRHKTLGSRRTDVGGRIFYTSTPQGASTFREIWFQLAEAKKNNKNVVLGRFEVWDNPVNKKDFVDELMRNMTQAQIQEEIYGKFADFSSSFFSIGDIVKAFNKGAGDEIDPPFDDPITADCLCETNNVNAPYETKAIAGRNYYTGVDVAGMGEDKTVLITLEEYQGKVKVVAFEWVGKLGLLGKAGVIERIHRRYVQYPGQVYFDASSLGGHQLDEVMKDKLPKYIYEKCTGISSTRKPGRSEFNHKRLMLTNLSLTFERAIITIPDCEYTKSLKSELRFYQLDDERIHQDTVMALALANYAFRRSYDSEPDFSEMFDLISGF